MDEQDKSIIKILSSLAVLGLGPAVIVYFTLSFKDQHLVLLGQTISEYTLSRLFAAALSSLTPIFLIIPFAFASLSEVRGPFFWLGAFFSPFLLNGPFLITGLIIGGQDYFSPLLALLLCCLLLTCLLLWMECLQLIASYKIAVLVYSSFWACSEFLSYLSLYILPYLEVSSLLWLKHLSWVLPQVNTGLGIIDDFLQGGDLPLSGLLPTFLQLPTLGLLYWFLENRNE